MDNGVARIYIAAWSTTILAAIGVAVRWRRTLVVFRRAYFQWLFRAWKLGTFGVAFIGMVIVAPYWGDPTWDYVTGGVQSVLTFVTAPWSVGTLYRRIRRICPVPAAEVFCAMAAWMISVSWFYDGYLTWRDGHYPPIWAENLFASSALYLLAGTLWSLGPAPEGKGFMGATIAFHMPDWPAGRERNARGVMILAGIIMLFTTALMAPFLVQAWRSLR